MDISRTEWIAFGKQFWCVRLPSSNIACEESAYRLRLTHHVDNPSVVRLTLSRDALLVRLMYQEAARLLLPSNEYNGTSAFTNQLLNALETLSCRLESADHELYQHSLRVLIVALRFLRSLPLPREISIQIRVAALFHDLGKLCIPAEILKKPSGLTPLELAELRMHPMHGAKMLLPITPLQPASMIVYHHHEHWDGRGYPTGLRGIMIPLGSRIISIADSFVVMTSGRQYRKPCSPEEALLELSRCAGTQFDPLLVDLFCSPLNVNHLMC